jgi:alkylated DNA repair dioxygenase AlkB
MVGMTDHLFTYLDLSAATVPQIPGLSYQPYHLTAVQQTNLLNWIDTQPWQTGLKRRVQHYGWLYDYRARRVTQDMNLGPIPSPLKLWCDHLTRRGFFDRPPDQVIVNEYLPGQGIAAHVDCEPCFGDTIAILSLGSPVRMDFTRQTGDPKASMDLEPGSLLVLTDQARYHWRHGIAARQTDPTAQGRRPRRRRVSVTFRQVITGQGLEVETTVTRRVE